jgi:glucokinase
MIGGVDIGGTKFAVGMCDRSGHILARAECPNYPEAGPGTGLQNICKLVDSTARQAGEELEGIGIGCTGPVDPQAGILGEIEFLPGWQGLNLVEKLQTTFGVTSVMENDADAAALGEFVFGAGQGSTRFIYLTISTGIGCGMIFDGQLYRGLDGSHPEIGHHIIDPSGPVCSGCGARGCWESLASGPALARQAGYPDARAACLAAEAGVPSAVAALKRTSHYLGLGIANLVTMFVPDFLALGGGVMQSRHLFWNTIENTIQENCRLVPHEKTRLVPARLGLDAGLVGASQAWIQRLERII